MTVPLVYAGVSLASFLVFIGWLWHLGRQPITAHDETYSAIDADIDRRDAQREARRQQREETRLATAREMELARDERRVRDVLYDPRRSDHTAASAHLSRKARRR